MGCQGDLAPRAREPAPGPAYLSTDRTSNVREAASQEIGPEAAAEIPPLPPKHVAPRDPGARAFVKVLAGQLDPAAAAESGPVRIAVRHIRNQSRASASEFDRFLQRFAEVLSDAGQEESLIFVRGAEEVADYEMLGTAYLVTAGGLDQWELFVRLSPSDASWTVWEASAPLRVIRHPRPGQPQVLVWPE